MAREAVLMPPRGRRRPGGWGNHWLADYQYETWRTQFEDRLIVLPQIETRRGLDNVDAIAAHELVTAIAVGPYDLSAELGCCWQPEDARLQSALARIRQAGRSAGKNMWMIGDGPTLARQGYTFICVGEPSAILGQRLAQIVEESAKANAKSKEAP
jgi:2-keto-3-deoxy-L-rhamnonate aldolase RhmA